MVADEELKRIYNTFTDCWRFYKKYVEVKEVTNEYWQNMINESEQIAKKYNDSKFVVDLLVVTCDELQRVYMEEKRKENDGNS